MAMLMTDFYLLLCMLPMPSIYRMPLMTATLQIDLLMTLLTLMMYVCLPESAALKTLVAKQKAAKPVDLMKIPAMLPVRLRLIVVTFKLALTALVFSLTDRPKLRSAVELRVLRQ